MKPIIMFVASVTVFMSLAACKSVTELSNDANGTSENFERSEGTEMPTEPTPEPAYDNTQFADNTTSTGQSVFAEPETPAPESLGASSSGLGR